MKLTDQQRAAVSHVGDVFVTACPGSGKTRTIVARLIECIDDVREGPRRVACITYTNAAMHEIEQRVRRHGTETTEHCDVVTIHAFCLQNILRYHYWRLPEFKGGFTVLAPDSAEFKTYVAAIGDEFGLSSFERQQFELLNRGASGEPIAQDGIPPEAVMKFWTTLQTDGYMDFCNIVYYSWRLLSTEPHLAWGLACRFKHLLVDEFQDTAELQVELLKCIAQHKNTAFFLVGDPEQSIYRFAGAKRELMFEFVANLGAMTFPLGGNYRSSKEIVACAERLIARVPAMEAVGESASYSDIPLHAHVVDYFEGITDLFLPAIEELGLPLGRCAILAPSWFVLRPLGQQLREYGTPIMGPGARPYRRSHLIARLAEELCAYVEFPDSGAIRAIEKELFHFIQSVTGRPNFQVFTFEGRRAIFEILAAARELRIRHEGAVEWLESLSSFITEALGRREWVTESCRELIDQSVVAILHEMELAQVDLSNLTLSDLAVYAHPENSLKLLTIHQAKGREFAAVAMIDVHEGRIPYYNQHVALTGEAASEARRLFYVGITRAERVLLFLTSQRDWRKPSRFLADASVVSLPMDE